MCGCMCARTILYSCISYGFCFERKERKTAVFALNLCSIVYSAVCDIRPILILYFHSNFYLLDRKIIYVIQKCFYCREMFYFGKRFWFKSSPRCRSLWYYHAFKFCIICFRLLHAAGFRLNFVRMGRIPLDGNARDSTWECTSALHITKGVL